MVDSATLARLLDHAEAAEAKLVLVGDPAQLGEIEAGGLFASLVDRSEPIVLDEVIRHEPRARPRGGAADPRRARGRGARALPRRGAGGGRRDPEARREAMVADWWRSYGAGEDALMVAKRNAEVERLNALAREVMKAEGRLGEAEIEVGDARFAAGDQVITRVNDNRARIYNRERWRVAEVDAEGRRVVLDGIDTRRRVCVDSDYLGAENPNDGSPALQHAYAATTYQAQGATVDRAYVMADPSMDRQEFYVAASRSREETWFYATPEIQVEREEYAPRSPTCARALSTSPKRPSGTAPRSRPTTRRCARGSRSCLARSWRDGATSCASEAGAEGGQRSARGTRRAARRDEELLERIEAERQALGGEPAGGRRDSEDRDAVAAGSTRATAMSREAAERRPSATALPAVEHDARAELAVIDRIARPARATWRSPRRGSPRPTTSSRSWGSGRVEAAAGAWDRAVREVEGYRQQHGIRDRDTRSGRSRAIGRRGGARGGQRVDQAGTATTRDGAGAKDREDARHGDRAMRGWI